MSNSVRPGLTEYQATNLYSILGVKTNWWFRILGEENFLINIMEGEKPFEQKSSAEIEAERLRQARAEFLALSGRFGEIERRVDGTLISNDEGFAELIPSLQKIFERKPRKGVGFFVGSGGVQSLLPELAINIPLVVDKNKAVLELSELLSGLISEETSPEAVLSKIRSAEIRERYPIISDIVLEYGNLDLIEGFLKKEGRQYGQFHWTNPQRFLAARTALKERPLVHIAADITSPDFAVALTEISRKNGQQLLLQILPTCTVGLSLEARVS